MNCPGSDRCEIREHKGYPTCLIAGECQKESRMNIDAVDVEAVILKANPPEPGVFYVKQWRPWDESSWRTSEILWTAPPEIPPSANFQYRILKLRLPV